MNTHPDFEELFRLLEENNVEYMVVGGYAVAFHGYPRFTKDIDIFFDMSADNIARLRKALIRFGFEERDLPEDVFSEPGNVLAFGVEPSRVDLINDIDGVKFNDARPNRIRGSYGAVEIPFIGIEDLIQNKRASGRGQDIVDAEKLEAGS
jgi:hypothetical protein